MSKHQVIVVGAGPAGVSAGLALKDLGVPSLILDQAEEVAASWRGRYDRLRLNTCRPLSHLPDRRYPKGTPIFPTRDQVVEHLENHAQEEGIELQLGTSVNRIDRDEGGWVLRTSAGEIETQQVVVATGLEHTPFIPDWRGRESFRGRLLHSRDYRNPEPFEDSTVLVVGAGSSGMEIAHDLATGGATTVWLSARTPPNITPRSGPGGFPGDMIAVALLRFPTRFGDAVARFGRRMEFGDLTEYGLPVPVEGVYTRLYRLGVAPAIVDMEVIDAIKGGRVEVVRGVESLDETGAQLADGSRVEPDVIICATGYRRGLEPLVGHLDVLDERGRPQAVGEQPAADGLRFLGYVPRPGALGYAAKQAKRVAKVIAGELRGQERKGARRERRAPGSATR